MEPLYDSNGIRVLWQGLVDTHTSGLDFRPDIYIENNSSESVSISPSNFYVNDILMSASNSGAITLEPGTRLMLSTRNSWNLSASDLIDVYGCDTIESFSFDLTIKQGGTTLADKMRVSLVTDIDIFELMGTNSFFTSKYPKGYTISPLITDAMEPLYDSNGIRVLWQGLVDTHTSGLDFRPDIYIENNSSESVSISPSNFYVNDILMSASNSGAITLEPGTRLMLSTRNSWNLPASDLIDVYGCDTIESISFDLTIKQGGTTLADKMRVSLVTDIDIFELMGTNSFFTSKYPKQ